MLKKIIAPLMLTLAIVSTIGTTSQAVSWGQVGVSSSWGKVAGFTGGYQCAKVTVNTVTSAGSSYAEDGGIGEYNGSCWAQSEYIAKGTGGQASHKLVAQDGQSDYRITTIR